LRPSALGLAQLALPYFNNIASSNLNFIFAVILGGMRNSIVVGFLAGSYLRPVFDQPFIVMKETFQRSKAWLKTDWLCFSFRVHFFDGGTWWLQNRWVHASKSLGYDKDRVLVVEVLP
jgi:hypothetical protein